MQEQTEIHRVSRFPDDLIWDNMRLISFEDSSVTVYDGTKRVTFQFPSREQMGAALHASIGKKTLPGTN
jgi:hypothetical protein